MSKKSSTVCYILLGYVDKGHRFLFSRLANSLKKCLDNYTMHTERINGEKYLSVHCRQWKFTLR